MIMYQSILSLTITRAIPEDSHVLTALGVGILNQKKIFYIFEGQMQELLDLFQRNWRQLEK